MQSFKKHVKLGGSVLLRKSFHEADHLVVGDVARRRFSLEHHCRDSSGTQTLFKKRIRALTRLTRFVIFHQTE